VIKLNGSGYEKLAYVFQPVSRFISKTVQYMAIVTTADQ